MPRKWRPGSPDPRFRGKLSPARVAWAKVKNLEVIMYSDDPETDENPGPEDHLGKGIRLSLRVPQSRPVYINLTALRVEELEAVRTIINMALDRAAPTCSLRDKVADDAFNTGDDSYERAYRQVPQLIVRDRQEPEHPSDVLLGREAHDGVEPDGAGDQDDDEQLRRLRDSLAEPAPWDVGGAHDGSPDDGVPDVRPVHEDRDA